MAKKELPHVEIETEAERFKMHISDDFDERILFSAPFGSGKSTFLKTFFEVNSEYLTFKLYPVNYSVAANQDVFELIKFDLLYDILNKYGEYIELQNDQFSMLLMSQMFLLQKINLEVPIKLLTKAASLIPGYGSIVEKSTDTIIDAVRSFSDYKKEVSETEVSILNNYIKSFKNKGGHAYESDEISELITTLLKRIVEAKLVENPTIKYKTVLLIDDLDRIDPEHVFRLFNVFSAHYNSVTETNKFNFDKIIFVCDVDNIAQMFHHRYGISVQFNGYIEKFYSSEIFRFDIASYLKNSLWSFIEHKNELLRFFPEIIDQSFVRRYSLTSNSGFYKAFEYVINSLIDFKQIHIRNFQRFKFFALPNYTIKSPQVNFHAIYYPVIIIFENLERFFPRPIDLEHSFEVLYKSYASNYSLESTKDKYIDDDYGDLLIDYCLPFIINEKVIFGKEYEEGKEYNFAFQNEYNQQVYLIYTVERDRQFPFVNVRLTKCVNNNTSSNEVYNTPKMIRPNPYWFLYTAYKRCRLKRYLN